MLLYIREACALSPSSGKLWKHNKLQGYTKLWIIQTIKYLANLAKYVAGIYW